jgi:hypothetical protein
MKDVTLITGPARSGTSGMTRLLEACGFDLGQNVRIVRNREEGFPSGSMEPDLLITINIRLLLEAGFQQPNTYPDEESLTELAANRKRYFKLFTKKFDGDLVKDPTMCFTLPFWEQHWPELRSAVFCLRHPLEVARSVMKVRSLSVEQALEQWHSFAHRFFNGSRRSRLYVLDFNALCQAPMANFAPLLDWLGKSMDEAEIQKCMDRCLNPGHLNWTYDEASLEQLPSHVRELYLDIRSRTGPWE